jgi:hypothetical protein
MAQVICNSCSTGSSQEKFVPAQLSSAKSLQNLELLLQTNESSFGRNEENDRNAIEQNCRNNFRRIAASSACFDGEFSRAENGCQELEQGAARSCSSVARFSRSDVSSWTARNGKINDCSCDCSRSGAAWNQDNRKPSC